jgi:hypothetical protein
VEKVTMFDLLAESEYSTHSALTVAAAIKAKNNINLASEVIY